MGSGGKKETLQETAWPKGKVSGTIKVDGGGESGSGAVLLRLKRRGKLHQRHVQGRGLPYKKGDIASTVGREKGEKVQPFGGLIGWKRGGVTPGEKESQDRNEVLLPENDGWFNYRGGGTGR